MCEEGKRGGTNEEGEGRVLFGWLGGVFLRSFLGSNLGYNDRENGKVRRDIGNILEL